MPKERERERKEEKHREELRMEEAFLGGQKGKENTGGHRPNFVCPFLNLSVVRDVEHIPGDVGWRWLQIRPAGLNVCLFILLLLLPFFLSLRWSI